MNRKQRRAAEKQSSPAAKAQGPTEAALLAQANRHQQAGQFGEAATLYRRALALRPSDAGIVNNLACVLLAQGKRAEASERFSQVLRLTPELFDAYADIMSILREVNPAVAEGIARAMRDWPSPIPAGELFAPGFAAVAADPLLLRMLEGNAVRDIGLERFLTVVRRSLLDRASDAAGRAEEVPLAFCCALARQCFINEYVFAVAADERAKADRLRDELNAAALAGAPVSAWSVAVLAAYIPLHSLPAASALLGRAWPSPVSGLLTQQISEPAEEQALRAAIPRLTEIEDEVSVRVRRQYEENPYPRWVFAPSRPAPMTIEAYLQREFPGAALEPSAERRDSILIAGCGTGLHSIGMAQRFKDCRLTAIDLSLASLAYAKRKTAELGLNAIDYAQADILRLGSLDRRFDVIDASGVLHHLADPMAGWRTLLSLLRPGGLMRIGLYSEIGRRDVVAARSFIAEGGYRPDADDIRRCRQDLMATALHGISRYYDFFGASECRDLMFHVEEHRVTIPDIDSFLRASGLTFIGFELGGAVRQAYARRFPDTAMTDLADWDAYERDNPSTFAGMYQFWVRGP